MVVDQNSPFWDRLINSLSGHGYIDGTTWETPEYLGQRPQVEAEGPPMPQAQNVPLPPHRPSHFGGGGHPAPRHAPSMDQASGYGYPNDWFNKGIQMAPWGRMISQADSGIPQQPAHMGRMIAQADAGIPYQGPPPAMVANGGGFTPPPSAFSMIMNRAASNRQASKGVKRFQG